MKLSRRTLIRGIAASTAGAPLIQYAAAADPQVAADRRFPYGFGHAVLDHPGGGTARGRAGSGVFAKTVDIACAKANLRIEANRPSEIFVCASKDADRIHNVRVGGYAVKVLEGTAIL